MKTIKPTIITALFLMGAILYGQKVQVPYMNTGDAEKSSGIENLVDNLLSMNDRSARKGYSEPAVYLSYTLNQAEVVYEEKLSIEDWMASPFECIMPEADITLESWMTVPFECSGAEDELNLEYWMTVPFQYSGLEPDPFIEKWMTLPFGAAEYIKIESWMTAVF